MNGLSTGAQSGSRTDSALPASPGIVVRAKPSADPSFLTTWALLLCGALVLDRTGVLPLGVRGLVAGTLFFVGSISAWRTRPRGTGRIAQTLHSARLVLACLFSGVLAATVARESLTVAFAVWTVGLVWLARRSALARAMAGASALLLPVVVYLETAQGAARWLGLESTLLSVLGVVAPRWNGSLDLIQMLPQTLLYASIVLLLARAGRVHLDRSVQNDSGPDRHRAYALILHTGLVVAGNVVILRYWHEMIASVWYAWDLRVWPTAVAPVVVVLHAVLAALAVSSAAREGRVPGVAIDAPRPSGKRSLRIGQWASGLAMGGVLGVALLAGSTGARFDHDRLRGLRVLVHDEGHLEFKSPSHDVLGLYSDGMFGTLTDYLESFGAVPRLGELTPEALDWAEVVLIINPPRLFDEREQAGIRALLARGGGLLCAGDHTATTSIRDPLNALMSDAGIALECDSAVSFQRHWLDSMRFLAHPVNDGFDRQEHVQVWIGGSLRLEGSQAFPLLIGANAFSDAPDFDTPGYLGDLSYDVGERMGGIVVAAGAETPGGGRLIAVGDTSLLQNTATSNSWAYLQRMLLWLGGGAHSQALPARALPLVLLLLGVAGAFYAVKSHGGNDPASGRAVWRPFHRLSMAAGMVVMGAALTLAAGGLLPNDAASRSQRIESPSRTLALIDRAHGNRFLPLTWGPDAVHGLEMSFTREGLTPVSVWEWNDEALRSARVVALLAPTHDLDAREARLLRTFLEDGGVVLVSMSPEAARNTPRLCQLLDVEIGDVPLARPAAITRFGRIGMYDAHPVLCREGAAETLAESPSGDPVLVWKPVGRGGALITGDPGFWMNKNLEDKEAWQAHNVHALWAMLRSYCGSRDAL